MLAHFCNAFLIRFSDFRHGIILEFAGPVFSRSPLPKATDDIFSRHTAFVCGGNPCSEGLLSHVQFLVSVPNLQAGAHGILDHRVQRSYGLGWDIRADHPDVPAVCHDVLSLSKLFDDFQGIVLSYAWIIRYIGVRYAFFNIYPFLRLLSNVDKDGLPELCM